MNKKKIVSLIPKVLLIIFLLIIINTQLTSTQVTGTLELGLIYSLLALGIFISLRILDIPDLTVDGSFTLGVAVSVVMAYNGHPFLGILLSIVAGAIAGMVTGVLQTKLKVQPILAGIITLTGLYSINLHIMGGNPNISLWKKETVFSFFEEKLPEGAPVKIIVSAVILIIVVLALYWFLNTQLGMAIRATGDNEFMVRASSINSDRMKIIGFAIANALVSMCGGVIAQYQSSGDANGGTGMLVAGCASIIIGEVFFGKHTIVSCILSSVVGATAYRYVLSFAISVGMAAMDFKLFSALIVAIAISIPTIKSSVAKMYRIIKDKNNDKSKNKGIEVKGGNKNA
ncbi:MAG: ABC transporter permease [Lachnospiraceae bacterium]|nr:ABC transporter permease [Lachnospiraceae bacterium]